MQHILFVAAKKWFCVATPHIRFATRRHRRSKIETFEIASLDVQRQRAMLWGTTTEYLSGFLHVAFLRARKKCIGVVPGKRNRKSQNLEGEGQMKTRAAVAFEAKKPLEIVELDLDGPKAGEVLVEIKATGICHTDAYTLDGLDSEGIFPSILGHEGAGIVREVGAGVISVKPGDHVIPLYTPECRQCKSCLSQKTNLCTSIRATQGKGVMPDGTSRFSHKGQTIFHYMGCSTFSNFTVLPEIAVAKIREDAPFDKSCYIGCGVT